MGTVLSGTIGQLTADRHWVPRDIAPLPRLAPLSGACDADQQSALSYASECLRAVQADALSKGKSIRWHIPEGVSLAGIGSCDAGAVTDVLVRLVSALSPHRLVAFSIEGHNEVTATDVHQWASMLGLNVLTMAPAPLWSSIRVANLSNCSLGDTGVQAFFSTVFPAATTTSAASRKDSGYPVPTPYRVLLPLLESVILDGVGLTDCGAVWVTSYLDDVARCMDSACLHGRCNDASASPDKRYLLRSLSLQRNRLGAFGVVKLLRTCVVNPFATRGASGHIIEAVDCSWNSLASVSGGGALERESDSAARRKLLSALGADMARSAPEGACSASPQPCIPLLLKGCGADEADVRALCTEGFLCAALERLRETAQSEMRDLPHSPARNLSLPPLCMQLSKIDLSHSPFLGDAGVGQLLSALLCLEATREVSYNGLHQRGSAHHTFCCVEEVLLREVSCTDAVLPDVVRLLTSNIAPVIGVSNQHGGAAHQPLDLGTIFEEEAHRALVSEARLLAGIRAEEARQNTKDVEKDRRMSGVYLPLLRRLDLSENSFSSAALVGAAMAGAALRASCLPSGAPGSPLMRRRAESERGGLAPRRTGPSAAPDEEGFALGLEDCGLADPVLTQFPLSLELLRAEMPACEEPPLSSAGCSATAAPQLAARPRSGRCTWYLGGNHFTQCAILRLRHFTEILVQRTSVYSQLCSLNAYVERNAILYPATSVEQSGEVDTEDSAAAAADSAAVSWLGITVLEDDAPGSGIDEQAASPSEVAFAGRCSTLNDLARPRVSWDQLLSLPTFADVKEDHDPSHSCIAPHSLQRRPSRATTTPFGACLHRSLFSSAFDVALPKTRGADAGAHLSRRASGGLQPFLSHTHGTAETSACMSHIDDGHAAFRPSPSSMPESATDFIEAFIAEAEQAFLERRTFMERIGHHIATAELLSCAPPPPLPDSDGGIL
ncbi:hypothetical protein GH5_03987 [Leishmania sp. Ghana 2012 LV757]|uniref:hypothetical protein n=1 Tax=Leishmania sp. Ghana 2012 LV757 TaxID=2803181 RepID=UPI001B5494B2|nr:hypothetical protein GH5_03987 [Leishmania sp. Ghana 2012 LV757]